MRVYVNAYSIRQCFGGQEEGGWWYDAGEPLASVPINVPDEHFTKDKCYGCSDVTDEEYYENNSHCEVCEGKRYVLNHTPFFDIEEVQAKVNELKKLFPEFEGNKKTRDQSELRVCAELCMATEFPQSKPYYE